MKWKNIKIRTQLIFSLAALFVLIVSLGIVSFNQNTKLHNQVELIYKHPLQVKVALGILRADIVMMQRDLRNLLISNNPADISENLIEIKHTQEDAEKQSEIISELYLGPASDTDSLRYSLMQWNMLREAKVREIIKQDMNISDLRNVSLNSTNTQVNLVYKWLNEIDRFSMQKSEQIYNDSEKLSSLLNRRLGWLLLASLAAAFIIFFILIRNIRRPLGELITVTNRFRQGDYNARSEYDLQNEFGELTGSFNTMARNLQELINLNKTTEELERVMLGENDPALFFRQVLTNLCQATDSHLAAVYMYNSANRFYELFESVGLNENARKTFLADTLEGETGIVLATRKIQHIKNIPVGTSLKFVTASSDITPREIITAPIISGEEVIAILTLATIKSYHHTVPELVSELLIALSARTEGILAFQRIKQISEQLESQNKELEAQQKELIAQSAMLREQNAELGMQKKQLAEASRLKTSFLSNMSHELRTPLNSVIALTGVLGRRLEGKIPAEEHSYLEVIERNGKNLLSLINDILDISRIESGQVELDIATFNLTDVITGVVSMISPQVRQKKIGLTFAPEQDLLITNDSDKIYHILQNLVSNAVKFTDEGGVEIRTSSGENEISVTIADSGIGIEEEHLPYIFDEFRQADSSTSRRYGGTGLGLSLAQRYAKLIGGRISVISTVGKGSVFTLTLPVLLSGERPSKDQRVPDHLPYMTTGSQKVEIIPSCQSKTILVVEDSEPAIIQIQDLLIDQGCNVLFARNGKQALDIVTRATPDAIILDLMMPGIDGFRVLQAIREKEETSTVPVLIITSKLVTKEELSFLKKNNIHQLVQKGSVNYKELLSLVQSMFAPAQQEIHHDPRPEREPADKPSILVVEDNPDNMLAVKAILFDRFRIIEACNGDEGIEAARKFRPDLILMDIEMPVLNGIEAFKEIKKIPELQNVPVIALTASVMVEDRETILASGFDAFVPKPLDESILVKTINKTLYGA